MGPRAAAATAEESPPPQPPPPGPPSGLQTTGCVPGAGRAKLPGTGQGGLRSGQPGCKAFRRRRKNLPSGLVSAGPPRAARLSMPACSNTNRAQPPAKRDLRASARPALRHPQSPSGLGAARAIEPGRRSGSSNSVTAGQERPCAVRTSRRVPFPAMADGATGPSAHVPLGNDPVRFRPVRRPHRGAIVMARSVSSPSG